MVGKLPVKTERNLYVLEENVRQRSLSPILSEY
jgi:hypothetical protein